MRYDDAQDFCLIKYRNTIHADCVAATVIDIIAERLRF